MENIGINNRKSLCRPKVIKLQAIFLPPTTSTPFPLFRRRLSLSLIHFSSIFTSYMFVFFPSLFHYLQTFIPLPLFIFHHVYPLFTIPIHSNSVTLCIGIILSKLFFGILPLHLKNICKETHFSLFFIEINNIPFIFKIVYYFL